MQTATATVGGERRRRYMEGGKIVQMLPAMRSTREVGRMLGISHTLVERIERALGAAELVVEVGQDERGRFLLGTGRDQGPSQGDAVGASGHGDDQPPRGAFEGP